jgi:hypothetical protein
MFDSKNRPFRMCPLFFLQVASFRNPFPLPRHFSVTLEIDPTEEEEESEAAGGMFDLLLRPPRLTLKPFTVAQIPFSFSAKSMSEHNAQLLVTQTGMIYDYH